MPTYATITPSEYFICDDGEVGIYGPTYYEGFPYPAALTPPTNKATWIHGSIEVGNYMFGTSRGINASQYYQTQDESKCAVFRYNLSTGAKDWVFFPIPNPNVAGEWFCTFESITFARGKLYFLAGTRRSTTGASGGAPASFVWGGLTTARLALIELDPDTLAWSVRAAYQPDYPDSPTRFVYPQAVASDTQYVYAAESASNGYLYRINLDTWAWEWFDYTPNIAPPSGGVQSTSGAFHSLVVDGTNIYACSNGANNVPSGTSKPCYVSTIRKSDMAFIRKTLIPQSTDDMAQNATHVFGGVETPNVSGGPNPTNPQGSWWGHEYGCWAVNKATGVMSGIARLGPEDVPSDDLTLNITSYASLYRGGLLVDAKTNGHIYVIDTSNADNWSLATDLAGVVLADCTFNLHDLWFSRAKLTRLASNQRGNLEAHNMCVGNEFLVGPDGGLHMFCWPTVPTSLLPPNYDDGVNPIESGTPNADNFSSSFISFTIPGFSFTEAPHCTTSLPDVDREANTAILHGEVTYLGGAAITERGFLFGIVNPPTTRVQAALGGMGTFSYALSQLQDGVTYYVQSYAINSSGEGRGEIVSFNVSALPGVFSGIVYRDRTNPVPVQGAKVLVYWNDELVASTLTDVNGRYTIAGATTGASYRLEAMWTDGAGTQYGAVFKIRVAP